MKTKVLLVCFFFCTVLTLSAQTAAELDRILESEAVSVGLAARFAMGAVGLLPEGLSGVAAETAAYEAASSEGWVRGDRGEAITLQDTAFLLMNVFELKGGIMYTLFRNPRYAYREMIYHRLIQGRSYSNMEVSGTIFLQILGRTLNYTGERERMDAMLAASEAFR